MRREKKYFIYLAVIVGILGLVYTMAQSESEEVVERTEGLMAEIEPANDVIVGKEAEVWEAIEVVLDAHTLEGITVIDMLEGEMEVDKYNRYFATFQVLGVDESEEISLYDYYMVIQQDVEGTFYMLPFGIEIMPSQQEVAKKHIMASTLKIANGWGMPESEFQKQWTNKVKSGDESITKEDSSMRRIYNAQQIISFMRQYIGDWLVAIDTQDETHIATYYEENSELLKKHSEAISRMEEENITIEVYELEVLDVICCETEDTFQVIIEGNMQIHGNEEIKAIKQMAVYTLKENNGMFLVTNEEVIKKE